MGSSFWRVTQSVIGPALTLLSACSSPHLLGTSSPATSPPAAVVPSAKEAPLLSLEARARQLVEAAARHDFDAASRDFDTAMVAAVPRDKFAAAWDTLEHQFGHFESLEKLKFVPVGGYSDLVGVARFERGSVAVKVVFDDRKYVAGLFFSPLSGTWQPPLYANPERFEERAVNVGIAPALPGTLTLPKSQALVPAVVLIHGSGPSDADETVAAVKVFKDLAWGLGSQNIAVLRYVKRSRQAPNGIVTQQQEVLEAAQAAIELLRTTPGVDPRAIFVVGHSQGGMLAPRIAEQNPAVAGIVVLAGPTRPLQVALVAQLTYLSSLTPGNPKLTAELEAAKRFQKIVDDPQLKADQVVELPTGGSVTGAYFLDARSYDPLKVAGSLPCPIFVLHGDRDYQVGDDEFQAWARALSKTKAASFKSYPALNHLFVSGAGPATPSEYQRPGHVDEAVIHDVARWVRDRAAHSG